MSMARSARPATRTTENAATGCAPRATSGLEQPMTEYEPMAVEPADDDRDDQLAECPVCMCIGLRERVQPENHDCEVFLDR